MNTSISTAISSTPLCQIPLLTSNSLHPPAPTTVPPAAAKARSSPPYVLPKKHRTTIRCPNKYPGNDCCAYVSTRRRLCGVAAQYCYRSYLGECCRRPACFICSGIPSPPPASPLIIPLLSPLVTLPSPITRAKSSPLRTSKEASNDNSLSK